MIVHYVCKRDPHTDKLVETRLPLPPEYPTEDPESCFIYQYLFNRMVRVIAKESGCWYGTWTGGEMSF